ncbi:MAG: hypothetical protein H6Q17_2475 [Bacteroidetes bacterium]|nr:hypothetical protein [Bacteroidota bacterium]
MSNDLVKYSHKILKDKNLIIEVLSGDFTIDILRMNRDVLYSDRHFNQQYDLLHDMRDATMNFTLEEHTAYLHYLGRDAKVLTTRKAAILTSEATLPKFTEWFDSFSGKYAVEFSVFSSVGKCLEWLDRSIHEVEITSELDKLRNSTCSQCFNEPNAFTGF